MPRAAQTRQTCPEETGAELGCCQDSTLTKTALLGMGVTVLLCPASVGEVGEAVDLFTGGEHGDCRFTQDIVLACRPHVLC